MSEPEHIDEVSAELRAKAPKRPSFGRKLIHQTAQRQRNTQQRLAKPSVSRSMLGKAKSAVGASSKFGKVAQNPAIQYAAPARGVVKMLKAKRAEQKARLADSKEFIADALELAERNGWTFESDDDVSDYLNNLIEAVLDEKMVGMAPIGAIKMGPQHAGGDRYPGLDSVDTDGQRAGPTTDTRSGEDISAKMDKKADIDDKNTDDKQTRGPDSYPALSYARDDGQRAGPKTDTRSAEGHHPVAAESLHDAIYNSLAGKRVRSHVNEGRNPPTGEIKALAEQGGFEFANYQDVENFMKLALCEKLYPSTGPTGHANQKKGDKIPGAMSVSQDHRGLKGNPSDGTTGQNKTGARKPMKGSGEAPHNEYKKDGPSGSTQQFEQSAKKICPVCNQKNTDVNAYCGACGAVLPPRPEDSDGGIPVKGKKGGSRNSNVATDGGTPSVRSPYGGSKSKHYYLKPSPKGMKEDFTESQMPESSRVVLYDMLSENTVDYSPKGVHDKGITAPALGAVNSKAAGLGLNPITDDELNRVVGMFQQGLTIYKVKLYTGVALRLTQSIANMMGIGSSHGIDRGMTDQVNSANLHPGA